MSKMRIYPAPDLPPEVHAGVRGPDDSNVVGEPKAEISGEVQTSETVGQPMYAFLDIGRDKYRWKRFAEDWEARFYALRNGFVFDGEVSEEFFQAHKKN